jgi:hypothetical protein
MKRIICSECHQLKPEHVTVRVDDQAIHYCAECWDKQRAQFIEAVQNGDTRAAGILDAVQQAAFGNFPRETCDCQGCNNKPTHYVALELRVHPDHKPAVSRPVVFVCAEHAQDVKWEDLVTDEAWQQIAEQFTQAGFRKPDRRYSNLKVLPLEKVQ